VARRRIVEECGREERSKYGDSVSKRGWHLGPGTREKAQGCYRPIRLSHGTVRWRLGPFPPPLVTWAAGHHPLPHGPGSTCHAAPHPGWDTGAIF